MDKVIEYAEKLQEKYESEAIYEKMELEDFIREQLSSCDPEEKESVFECCENKEMAVEEIVYVCHSLYK